MTVKARQFYTTLNEVVKRASKDEALPAICTVQLIVKNGTLFMIATDRFKVAVGRIADTGLEDGEWLSGRGDVEGLLKIMRWHKLGSTKSDKNIVELEPGDEWQIVTQDGIELTMSADRNDDFPKVSGYLKNDWNGGIVVAGDKIGADKNYHYGFSEQNNLKPQFFVSAPNAEFNVVGVVMPINTNGHADKTPWDKANDLWEELEDK